MHKWIAYKRRGGVHSKFHPIALILNHTLHFLLRCHHFLACSAPISKSLELHVHNSNDSCNLCLKTVLSCLTVSQQISKLSIVFVLILYCVLQSKYKFFSNVVLNFILHFVTCNITDTQFKNLVFMSSFGSQSQCKASVYTSTNADLVLHSIHSAVFQLKASLLHKHKKKFSFPSMDLTKNMQDIMEHAQYSCQHVWLPHLLKQCDSNPQSQFYFNYTIKLIS